MLNRMLLIDDSEDIEFMVRICATRMSSDVILEMYDPRCGMPESSFNWSRYDLLLLDFDLGLPKQNGLDRLTHFKQNRKLPPVIMLTAYSTKKLETVALARGVDGFMDKDKLTPQLFSDTVRTVLETRSRRKPLPGVLPGDELTQAFSAEQMQKALGDVLSEKAAATRADAKELEQTRAFTGD